VSEVKSKSHIRRARIHTEAEGYLELGMAAHALDTLARLDSRSTRDLRSLYLHGEALRTLERFHEALEVLLKAADVAPGNLHVRLAIGWCYKRTGQIGLAIDSLERVLAIEPTEALLHYNLACYWSLAGDRSRAINYLSQALSIEPDYRHLVDDESDFDPVRGDPEFQAVCRGLAARNARSPHGESSSNPGEPDL
jgi:tetratricopeptide (TPR) repeat protein